MDRTTVRPYDLLIVGELNVDVILSGDVTPEFGQVEKIIGDMQVCAGASTGIFCASAARMGLRVLLSSVLGDDPFGHFMLTELRRAGVETAFVQVDERIKTGATFVLSRGQDRAMLTYLGSIAAVGPQQIHPAWYAQARHLHVASPFLLEALRPALPEMMRAAKRAGMTVSLDTNWDPSGRWEVQELLDFTDILLPNENEVRALSGEADLERAIAVMAQRVPLLVVKLGAAGALAMRGQERVQVGAFPVAVADTTGAGDTFDGGFLAAWLRGETLEHALQLGCACGALTASQVGGFNGQPTWEEAQRFVAAVGKR
jgi:sugar/nucleoside kinase (ribokinase family)